MGDPQPEAPPPGDAGGCLPWLRTIIVITQRSCGGSDGRWANVLTPPHMVSERKPGAAPRWPRREPSKRRVARLIRRIWRPERPVSRAETCHLSYFALVTCSPVHLLAHISMLLTWCGASERGRLTVIPNTRTFLNSRRSSAPLPQSHGTTVGRLARPRGPVGDLPLVGA